MNPEKKFKLDFLGIGAAKCGTSWLTNVLREHPQVFVPNSKELHYFNKEFIENEKITNLNYSKPLKWYASFFKSSKKGQLNGEFSPSYLWSKNAAKDIYNFNPKIKIIAILRNPIGRSFSQYLFYKQKGMIGEISFEEAIKIRKEILSRSLYYEDVKTYLNIFPKKNVKVVLFDDLVNDNIKFLYDIEDFLDIKKYIPDNINEKFNVTGIPRFRKFNVFITNSRLFLRKYNLVYLIDFFRLVGIAKIVGLRNKKLLTKKYNVKPKMNKKTKIYLKNYFKEDIKKLESLLNRNLSHWI